MLAGVRGECAAEGIARAARGARGPPVRRALRSGVARAAAAVLDVVNLRGRERWVPWSVGAGFRVV